jgi:hypothetical protein
MKIVKKIYKVILDPEARKLKMIYYVNFFIYFTKFILRKSLSFFVGQKIFLVVNYAPIRSLASISVLINKINSQGKFYSLHSFPYGNKFKKKQTLISDVYRILGKKNHQIGFKICENLSFRSSTQFIYLKRSNPKIVIKSPVYLLTYYNTHFGHYSGEILGLLSLYSNLIVDSSNRKLLYVEAGDYSEFLINAIANKNKLFKLKSEVCLKNRIDILDAIPLPPVHPWQNLIYLKNQLEKSTFYKKTEDIKGIFLTSGRHERIYNLDCVVNLFLKFGFKIIYMDKLSKQNCSEIRNTETFFCDDASISHVPLIHRHKKYFVFATKGNENYSESEYSGGYIFNELDYARRVDIKCEVIEKSKIHFMTSKLKVDITNLQKIIEDEISN